GRCPPRAVGWGPAGAFPRRLGGADLRAAQDGAPAGVSRWTPRTTSARGSGGLSGRPASLDRAEVPDLEAVVLPLLLEDRVQAGAHRLGVVRVARVGALLVEQL